MSPLSRQLSSLKLALQDLESAVQFPPEERWAADRIVESFPPVMKSLQILLCQLTADAGNLDLSLDGLLANALQQGLLTGTPDQWVTLVSIYENLASAASTTTAPGYAAIIRNNTAMVWTSYELLSRQFTLKTKGPFSVLPRAACTASSEAPPPPISA